MIPYTAALEAWRKEPNPGQMSWDDALAWHFNMGFVFSTPRYFMMGRPVVSESPMAKIFEYGHVFPANRNDAWFIACAAGNLSDAWAILPWRLPLIGFDRKGEVRFYDIERVRRLTYQPTN
jgi:hypothetical protein